MVFKKGEPVSSKKDGEGTVVVKIFLQDPKSLATTAYPAPGNRKEEFTIPEATVGNVFDAIHKALFEGEKGDA